MKTKLPILISVVIGMWLFFGFSQYSYAQQYQVKGRVIDSQSQKALPGVDILVKGTTNGTTTDPKGLYTLNVSSLQDTLIFSYIGYKNSVVPINGRKTINVSLVQQTVSGGQLVVVGYGTQQKQDLTGSVSTVSSNQLANLNTVSNPASTLQGKLPGLQVMQSSGQPGDEGVQMKIRGMGTFSGAGTNPLVIIDGIPGNLNSINPSDIANVTVLKDAASAAIYGARAANGVILVTTKKGSRNGFHMQYNFDFGINKPTRLLNIVTNSAEYMTLYNEALKHDGLPPAYTQNMINTYKNATNRVKYPNTNWLNIMFNPAYVTNQNLSLSGGSNGTRYRLSLGYINQPGTMMGFHYNKYTLGLNLNSKINKSIKFGSDINLHYGKRLNPRQGARDEFLSTLSQAPMYRPTLPNSNKYTYMAYNTVYHNKNPYATAQEVQAINHSYYLNGNIHLDINLLKNLVWETKGGINFNYDRYKDFRPTIPLYNYLTGKYATNLDVGGAGSMNLNTNHYIDPTVYSQLTYQNNFGKHNVKILAGAREEHYIYHYLNGYRRNFPNNELRQINAGSSQGQSVSSSTYEWALRSFYGRLNYSYNNKYLFQANLRYDGSSRFAPGHRWGAFPSFSVGWRISKESFLKNVQWLSNLKLRGSWGRLGNQNIGDYPYEQVYNLGANYPYSNTSLSPGARPSQLVNRGIRWETTQVLDFGFDLSVLNDRLKFTADWYKKMTYGILRTAQIPFDVGLNPPTINDGKMQNTGIEFSAKYNNVIGDLHYSIGGNLDANKNKLVKFGSPNIGGNNIEKQGLPWNTYYLYQVVGIFQSQQEINNSPKQPYDPQPGDLKFKDVNGDGVINQKDRVPISGVFPKFTYSFDLNATYKNFDFTASFYGVYGKKQYVQRWGVEPFFQSAPPTVNWLHAWTPQNHSTTMPAIYRAGWGLYPAIQNMPSTFYLKDASYFRLQDLTVGYNLPKRLFDHYNIVSGIRIYFEGQNLFTITPYPYMDPEHSGGFASYVSYPQNKIFSFGIQLKF